jgi:hypothetical protein
MNKSQIRSQFLALLNRNDCSNELADTFIEQAVARIQRTLRVPAMEKVQTYTVGAAAPETLILPSDFLQVKYLYVGDTLLEYVDLGRFFRYSSAVGGPKVYTRIQGALKVRQTPAEGTEVVLVYYGEIEDLVEETDESFISVAAPDLLINAGMTYACDYFVDDRKQVFENKYAEIMAELNEQAYLTEMESSGMAIATPTGAEY